MFPSPFARLFGMVSAPFATNNTVIKGTKLSENRTVIRKLSFAPRSRAALSLPIAAQFLRRRRRSSLVTAVRFSNGQEAFSLTTAAQNIHVFPRKSPLLKEHFFELLKTTISSNACGTSTLKSPPPRAFSVPDVHLWLRKCLSRCTLDCGFKTPESPALRGFVAERCPITGTSLYLVLKSNGFHRPKIRLKKFSFSSKSVPANIAKKLPLQLRPKPLFIAFFNFSHKRPTFAFAGESGLHTRLSEKGRTQGLTRRNRVRFGWGRYYYPRSVPHVHKHPRAGYQNGVLCRFWVLVGGAPKERREPRDSDALMRVAVPRRRGPAGLRDLFATW